MWLLWEPQILASFKILFLLVARVCVCVYIYISSFKEVGWSAGKRMGSHLEATADWLCDLKQITLSGPQFLHL